MAATFLRPIADISIGGWEDDGGGTTDIYQSIDETFFSDADYITSTTLNLSSETYVCDLGDLSGVNPNIDLTLRIRSRRVGVLTTDWTLRDADDTTIASGSLTPSITIFTENAFTISHDDLAGHDLSQVDLVLFAEETLGVNAVLDVSWVEFEYLPFLAWLRPVGDISNVGWEDEGSATTDLYQSIDEVTPSDSDYITCNVNQSTDTYVADMGDLSNLGLSSDVMLRMRIHGIASGTVVPTWRLRDANDVEIDSVIDFAPLPADFETYNYIIPAANFSGKDLSQVDLVIEADEDSGVGGTMEVSWVEIGYARRYVRPVGDISVGGWQADDLGTTDLYQHIDEATPSDADYIWDSVNEASSTHVGDLGDISDMDLETDVILRTRSRITTGFGFDDWNALLRDQQDSTIGFQFNLNSSGSFVLIETEYAASDFIGQDLGQVDYRFFINNLTQQVRGEVSWVELEMNTPPSRIPRRKRQLTTVRM